MITWLQKVYRVYKRFTGFTKGLHKLTKGLQKVYISLQRVYIGLQKVYKRFIKGLLGLHKFTKCGGGGGGGGGEYPAFLLLFT